MKCWADLIAFTYAVWMLLSMTRFFRQTRFCNNKVDTAKQSNDEITNIQRASESDLQLMQHRYAEQCL